MQLKMTVASAQARSLGPDAVAHFRLRGGTLGRSRDNDWVLPDPQRIVSGHHARIIYEQGTYYIEDSSANGTFLNQTDTPLPKGQPVALDHGDILYIGDYEIQVELLEGEPHPSGSRASHTGI
jgi:type VI secretion system FHA domain protein